MNITLGSDMEFFCEKEGKIVISQGIVPGSKDDPQRITEDILVHRDNCLGEFTVKPAASREEWLANIKDAKKVIHKLCHTLGIKPVFKSAHAFTMEELMHPECLTFGCEPDFTAVDGSPNEAPDPWEIGGNRSAGGHIHIGYDNPTEEMNMRIVKHMDILLGTTLATTLEKGAGINRRSLYGKAGCFRHKPYGVEYRTPGPEWFMSTQANIGNIWDMAVLAVNLAHLPDMEETSSYWNWSVGVINKQERLGSFTANKKNFFRVINKHHPELYKLPQEETLNENAFNIGAGEWDTLRQKYARDVYANAPVFGTAATRGE